MTLHALPVMVHGDRIETLDGSALPAHARAVLVIFAEQPNTAGWEQAFEAYFAHIQASPKPSANPDDLSDGELNTLIHHARRS